ncbi:MAG TPA: hypothetical protein P5328_02025 [Candidatus Paceibacterota bacterium]|nr:hypothetical protein [Candidatus Paceibacterota bacterium]HRZ34470.1 hypothetical protein [Candidatus Paceibacterota bacterium]
MKYLMILVHFILAGFVFMFLGMSGFDINNQYKIWQIVLVCLPSLIGIVSILTWFYCDSNGKNYKPWFWLSVIVVPIWFLISYSLI